MENYPRHDVVALQFNLGAARKPKGPSTYVKQVSKHVGRHLIYQYLKQSIIPDPAFIALQDELSNVDVDHIRDVLHECRRKPDDKCELDEIYKCAAWHGHKDGKDALPPGKKAALLYDTKEITYDTENPLVEDDFFDPRNYRAQRLFNRLDGGLFLHKPSQRFIVAVSYHGEKNDTKDEKKAYIWGRCRRVSFG
jgi:hypothetical protein